MIHENKDEFIKMLDRAMRQTGFLLPLLENDYYLTLILSQIHKLSEDLIFKGGTCLNKVHFFYYRLSEDLDFSMRLPACTSTRGIRRKCIQPIKDNIERFVEQFGVRIDGLENAGRNESKQYVYYFIYQSALQPIEPKIKFEIGLRYNPLCEIEKRKVHHKFLHPFTGEPLFDAGEVNCLMLKELIAEKLRAAAIRRRVAPRDFYDLDFALRNNFNIADYEVTELFKKKLAEDGADTDLAKYRVNMGRKDEEIKDMRLSIKEELFEVLTPDERKNFNLDNTLKRINETMKRVK